MRNDGPGKAGARTTDAVLPDLQELCRIHDIGLEMIERSDDVDELLDRILDEYEERLDGLGSASLARPGAGQVKVRALVMFAAQAAALKEKAALTAELKRRSEALEHTNEALRRALLDEEHGRRRLDEVLAAVDAGIVVLDPAGRVRHANRAAAALTGRGMTELLGADVGSVAGDVPRGGDGELSLAVAEQNRTLLVARRDLPSEPGAEVLLFSDVTAHERELDKRNRLERLAEMMRTLGVLSHKINNPLTSLMGRAQLLRRQAGADERVVKAAEVIEESARRIADYIRELAREVKAGRQEGLERLLEMEDAVGVTASGSKEGER